MNRLILVLLAALALGACRREPAPPAEPAQPRTMPVDPTAPLQLAKPDEVRVRLDLDSARSAIRMHQQEHGASPPNIEALELKLNYPDDLTYDPASGTLTSKTYPRF